jgi:hypothetical protein
LLARPGLFANADHAVDDGLIAATEKFSAYRETQRAAMLTSSGATDWDGWWERLRAMPELSDAVAARDARFSERGGSSHTESTMPASWHIATLRATGYAEAGLAWRGLNDAVVVGTR